MQKKYAINCKQNLQLSTGYASQQKVKEKLSISLSPHANFCALFSRAADTQIAACLPAECVCVCECVNVSVKSEWRNVLAFPSPLQGTEEGKRSRRGRMDEVASVSTNSLPAFGGAP